MNDLQNNGSQIVECLDIPRWIEASRFEGELTDVLDELKAITEGGCSSGAYMPAVTYYDAIQTMANHGDEVYEFIHSCGFEPTDGMDSGSWGTTCCHVMSLAVELWAIEAVDHLHEEHFNG